MRSLFSCGGLALALAVVGCDRTDRPLAALLEPQPSAETPSVAPRTPAPPPPTRVIEPPRTIAQALEERDGAVLSSAALDGSLPQPLRYSALRRLEELDSPLVVPTAAALLSSDDRFLRSNAIVVLVRSEDPAARDALARLSGPDQALAQALLARQNR